MFALRAQLRARAPALPVFASPQQGNVDFLGKATARHLCRPPSANSLCPTSAQGRLFVSLATAARGAAQRPWGCPPPALSSCGTSTILLVEVGMASSIPNLRLRASVHQGFRCYYCGLPFWIEDPVGFAARYRLTTQQARYLRCTAEHLQARVDGGSNRRDNVVAACTYCNTHRHRRRTPLLPPDYQAHVRRRMRQGRWLAALLPRDFVRRAESPSKSAWLTSASSRRGKIQSSR